MRGGTARGWFLNGVVRVETALPPAELLAACIAIERREGRRRARHWGDRTLDLDLLLHDAGVVREPGLTLPHPGIAARPFVWLPLREVWPDARDPVSGKQVFETASTAGPQPVPIAVMAWPPPTGYSADPPR
jgi:2-amino-4-hydroxy-6-hydroxymethyldihydropteridine diphosphokinase